jgi:hypothetical protein
MALFSATVWAPVAGDDRARAARARSGAGSEAAEGEGRAFVEVGEERADLELAGRRVG